MEFSFTATNLMNRMKEHSKFDLNLTQLGRHLKLYPENVITKKATKYGVSYILHSGALMRQFLIQQGWWIE
jgi:hypothetical protein